MKDGVHPPLFPAAPGPPHRPLSSAPGAWGDRFLLLWTGPGLRCGHRDAYPCSASARDSPRPRQAGASSSGIPWHGTVREGLLATGPFPHPLQPHCPRTPKLRAGVPQDYCPKAMHPPSWEPSPAQASVSEVAAWSPTKGSSSPLSRRSRNSAACSKTWMLLATGSMSATAGCGWA